MKLSERITALTTLGSYLKQDDERLQAHAHRASVDNPWFTGENIKYALDHITTALLDEKALKEWTAGMKSPDMPSKRVGVIMAGNIPLVGFHDVLCIFISGNQSVIKLSDKDRFLIPFLLKVLAEIDPRVSDYFEIVEKLERFDAVIATGSNNSARYFEYYFGKYPHVIRRNRNAVALLDGDESDGELSGLCDDIFMYFGLGCRSVSSCFVPEEYDFGRLIVQAKRYNHLAMHDKFKNNLDYSMAIHILNQTPHIALPNLMLMENPALISPVGCLHYTHYADLGSARDQLLLEQTEIQCVITHHDLPGLPCVGFGEAQKPALRDYADGIDTLAFLQTLS